MYEEGTILVGIHEDLSPRFYAVIKETDFKVAMVEVPSRLQDKNGVISKVLDIYGREVPCARYSKNVPLLTAWKRENDLTYAGNRVIIYDPNSKQSRFGL